MLTSILSIFIVILIGYLLRRFKILKPSWTNVLNSFVYYISLPILIFNTIATYEWSATAIGVVLLSNALYVFLASIVVVLLLSMTKLSKNDRGLIILAILTGNTVYLGIPLSNELLGGSLNSSLNGPITAISITQLVTSIVCILIALEFFLIGSRNFRAILIHIVKNPLVISTFIGSVIALIGGLQGSFLRLLEPSLSMIASTASPLALIALGAFLYGHKIRKRRIPLLLTSVVFKNVLLPISLFLFIGLLMNDQSSIKISTLLASMPVAATAFVIAKQYKLDAEFIAMSILVTTVLAPITISLISSQILQIG